MIDRILRILVTILLILFPILGGMFLGKHSPYIEGNSMADYILIYSGVVLVIALCLFFITHRFRQWFIQPVRHGIILFFVGCIMLGIAGLAAPPDLGEKMLQHPEREHFRYILLFGGAIFFGWYFIDLFINDSLQLAGITKWLFIIFFTIAMIELVWEFNHHYHYPEGLREWVDKRNKVEDFSKNYDDWKSGTVGCIGRFFIYSLIGWLSIILYKKRRTRLWSSVITILFCMLGLMSVIVLFLFFNYEIKPPKSLEFLFIFFIPGVPFLLMYWIGVALLIRKQMVNK